MLDTDVMKTNFVALITGSSKGLGLSIAKSLAKHQVKTILTARSSNSLNLALSQLHGNDHVAFTIDFTKEDELDLLLENLYSNGIIPNILIHNIGYKVEGDSFPLNVNIVRKSLKINLEVAIKINEFFLPIMTKNKFGRIIHISSDASLTGQASPAYVIAKSALNGYIKTAARFNAKNNIMMCAVLPGILEHEGSAWAQKKITQPEHYKDTINKMPLGRFGQPEEVADLVAELATNNSMMCAGSLFELCAAAF